jgi:hypothetical protein
LTKEHHRLLVLWAADCAERLLPEYERQHHRDSRLRQAIVTGRAWARGEVLTGAAMKAAVACHAAAREATDSTANAIARAVGHAVATAHFADHCLGVAIYALKAFDDDAAQAELRWQISHLPEPVCDLVCSAIARKLPQVAFLFQPQTSLHL